MPERVGLIRARLAGLPYSTAEVVTYLDSHCECTNGKSKKTSKMIDNYNDILVIQSSIIFEPSTSQYRMVRASS